MIPNVALTGDIERLLQNNAPVAIGISGGKDSQAVAYHMARYLEAIGHTGPRLLVHSDLGRIEWEDSLRVCERIAATIPMELVVLRRNAGDMISRFEKRWQNNVRRYLELSCVKLILPWATASMRFCTSELKSSLICSYLRQRFPGQPVVNVTGVRAAESAARSRALPCGPNAKLSNKKVTGYDWRPILNWGVEDVFSFIASEGQALHEAYTTYGSSRVSCSFCVLASANDLKAAARCESNHAAYRLLVGLEARSTFSFQEKKWLGDVATDVLSSEMQAAVAEAKKRARQRENAEKLIPEHLLYAAGWPTAIPSLDEAAMLGRVRGQVCSALGLEPTFTEPAAIVERYQELLDIKEQKVARRQCFESPLIMPVAA